MRSKIFKSGNSQAVRLPKSMRLESDEVMIHRLGDALLIQPLYETWIDLYHNMPPVSDDFFEDCEDAAPEERDWL